MIQRDMLRLTGLAAILTVGLTGCYEPIPYKLSRSIVYAEVTPGVVRDIERGNLSTEDAASLTADDRRALVAYATRMEAAFGRPIDKIRPEISVTEAIQAQRRFEAADPQAFDPHHELTNALPERMTVLVSRRAAEAHGGGHAAGGHETTGHEAAGHGAAGHEEATHDSVHTQANPVTPGVGSGGGAHEAARVGSAPTSVDSSVHSGDHR